MEAFCFVLLSLFSILLFFYSDPWKQGFHTRDTSIQFPLLPLTIGLKGVLLLSFVCPATVIMLTERCMYSRSPVAACKRFSFMTLVNVVTMLFFKFAVGRLRPHFIVACQPSVDLSVDRYYSAPEYECRSHSRRLVSNAHQSFYSGHASLAAGAAFFLVLYVQHHYPRSLTRATCQLVALLVGTYPGITQIHNHWHHVSDVLTGFAAGVTIATAGFYAT